jgi:predicted RNA-binding protein with PUA-like domain
LSSWPGVGRSLPAADFAQAQDRNRRRGVCEPGPGTKDQDQGTKGPIDMNWLFKEEPTHYSYDDLVRDGSTSWTGVRNPLAQKHLRGVRKGDRIFFYHTGNEKAVVGIARALGAAYPDPGDKNGKLYAVDVGPVKKLKAPVTLAAIKSDRSFAAFPLVRMARLSVMPVSDDEWTRIEKMSG